MSAAYRHDLVELVTRLTRCIDLKTFPEMSALYLPDAELVSPMGVIEGANTIVEFAQRNHEQYAATQHLVCGTTVEVEGESAVVVADVVAVLVPVAEEPGTNIQLGSRYELATAHIDGVWRITRQTITPLWQRTPMG
ncbi:nuclear transport factor 2 family protein [Smaragdicoccus niigatensis]|uniref:nuclear transport factor 2 family protein n=1 Tax=Smaragdicoccus niigatensis TaxID=359359 RepID=UPI00035F92BF|nr:nuclear transport factor 2 family protein [Smaragdicoccus niigatensis]